MLRRLSVYLVLGWVLSACQPLVPQPAPVPTPSMPPGWQVWAAASSPQGINDLSLGATANGSTALWAATAFGVVQIDPQSHAYTSYDTPGPISRLLPIESGRVMAVSDRGLVYFDGRTWQSIAISSTYGFYPPNIYGLGVDDAGDLWLYAGVSRSFVTIHLPGHEPPHTGPWVAVPPTADTVFRNARDCAGWRLYSEYSFAYQTPDECQRLSSTRQAFEQRAQYGPLAVDADGTVWWLNADRLHHFTADGTLISQLPIASGMRLVSDPRGGVWVATIEGLFYATEGHLQHIALGLEAHTLYLPRAIAVEANGRVWAATERGLQSLKPDTQQWLLEADAHLGGILNQSPAASLVAAPTGGLWLTHGFDLLRYDGTTIIPSLGPPADSGCGLGPVQIDRNGDLWAAAFQCGVWQYRAATNDWVGHQTQQYIDQLAVGADGTVVALTGDGQLLARAFNGEWSTLGTVDRTVGVIMVSDQHGGAWVGSLVSGEVTHYTSHALPATTQMIDANTYFTLLSEPSGRLWLSTHDRVWQFNGTQWQAVVAPSIGLLNTLTVAPDGRVWFTSERGIAVYDPTR